MNLLIVDDSLVIRAMMTDVLQKDRDINIVGAAASCAEAGKILSQTLVDVVTLDVEMPGVSGLDYLDTLVRRGIPVVMLSGQTGEGSQDRATALAKGAVACFDKANAVRQSSDLIRMVKDAANSKVNRPPVAGPVHEAGEPAAPDQKPGHATEARQYFFHVTHDGHHPDQTGVALTSVEQAVDHGHALLAQRLSAASQTREGDVRIAISIVDRASNSVARISSVVRTVID